MNFLPKVREGLSGAVQRGYGSQGIGVHFFYLENSLKTAAFELVP
jgi:hypothetical protein